MFRRRGSYADSDEEARAEQLRQRFGAGSDGAGHGVLPPGAATPSARERRLGVLMAMLWVGAGFIVMLGTGFRLSGDPEPPIITQGFYPAIVVFAVVTVRGLIYFLRRPARPRRHKQVQRWGQIDPKNVRRLRQAAEEERRQRLARLKADPLRRKYAELIDKGQPWSDEQIAYDLDLTRTATCEHLQAVERAIRQAHIGVRLVGGPRVEARCVVDREALHGAFALAPSVDYHEPQQYDRSLEDPPGALIWCSACNSAIAAIHPSQAPSGTRMFPS